jgi:hypothetical protein
MKDWQSAASNAVPQVMLYADWSQGNSYVQ